MPNYDFLNLSPIEFEDLTRDLIQKKDGIILESFTTGRDQGIDFRYAKDKKNEIIIQCKKYNNFNNLKGNLKKELKKIKSINPEKYVLVTSLGLTPSNKETILKLLSPHIIQSSDIIGKDDLNNFLNLYPEIEKSHFKLWLSSVNILEKILHSKVINQSQFELEEIRNKSNIYVLNDSFKNALDILKKTGSIIISGIPGIGKTTLARMLVYNFLANDYQEFVYISDSISEGYELYKNETKQVFLFDDFLGSNFLNNKLNHNEDKQLLNFINKIKFSKDKIFIMTTREYILSQARIDYEKLDSPTMKINEFILDLSQYTKFIRAEILYNHLYFSNIDYEIIEEIVSKKYYNFIVEHKNFNPRTIEAITNKEIYKNYTKENFITKVNNFLDNPENIWKHAYENQISNFSKCLLMNILSAGTPIHLSNLKLIIENFSIQFSSKYQISYNEFIFNNSLKELENSFIILNKERTGVTP